MIVSYIVVFMYGAIAYWAYEKILKKTPPICFYLNGLNRYYRVCKNLQVTFDDIIGCDGIKQELLQYNKYADKMKCGKGFLFTGPNGNGKTFMAKAFANLVNSPFVEIDTRNEYNVSLPLVMEEVCLRYGQCVIFIDECETIVKSHTDTLLKDLDGIVGRYPLFLILATSGEVPKSLTRSGRIDKIIQFNQPTQTERILMFKKMGIKGAKRLASKTANFSFADIARVKREMDLMSEISKSPEGVVIDNILKQIKFGIHTNQIVLTDKLKERLIYHEIGHVLVAYLLGIEFNTITIQPCGNLLGHVELTPGAIEKGFQTKSDIITLICIYLASSVAETFYLGEYSTGCQSDFARIDEYLALLNNNSMLGYRTKLDDTARQLLKKLESWLFEIFKDYDHAVTILSAKLEIDGTLNQRQITELLGNLNIEFGSIPVEQLKACYLNLD